MKRKGTYVLFLSFYDDIEAEVGALGTVRLDAGDYCYVGSAMGGLDQRISRHLAHTKKIRWHIDRLTVRCDDMAAYESEGESLPECRLAEMLTEIGSVPAFDGFGCSDCCCRTHLFRVDKRSAEVALECAGMHVFVDKR